MNTSQDKTSRLTYILMFHVLKVAQFPVRPEGVDRRLKGACQLLQSNTDVVRGVHGRAGGRERGEGGV